MRSGLLVRGSRPRGFGSHRLTAKIAECIAVSVIRWFRASPARRRLYGPRRPLKPHVIPIRLNRPDLADRPLRRRKLLGFASSLRTSVPRNRRSRTFAAPLLASSVFPLPSSSAAHSGAIPSLLPLPSCFFRLASLAVLGGSGGGRRTAVTGHTRSLLKSQNETVEPQVSRISAATISRAHPLAEESSQFPGSPTSSPTWRQYSPHHQPRSHPHGRQ